MQSDRTEQTRPPRPCPVCDEIFEPRKVGGTWTKSCSKPCANQLVAKAMREGGGKKASAARQRGYPPHVELVCAICGKRWNLPPSQAKGRRTCSVPCAAELKRRKPAGDRCGTSNPNWKNGSRVGRRDRAGERRWYTALGKKCMHPSCPGTRGRLVLHHLCYRQHVKNHGGDIWDPRNAMTLCNGCHMSHHARGKYMIPLASLPDSVFEFAAELLGGPAAFEYLARRYQGQDLRHEALLDEGVNAMTDRVVSVSQMRDQLEEIQRLQFLACAQALRLIRDTCPGVAATIAKRVLEEARIPDPDEDENAYY